MESFFYTKVDRRCREAMALFLASHPRACFWPTERKGAQTYANKFELSGIGKSVDGLWEEINGPALRFGDEHAGHYSIVRSVGGTHFLLVPMTTAKRSNTEIYAVRGMSAIDSADDDFKALPLPLLRDRVDLVAEFDRACDKMVAIAKKRLGITAVAVHA